MKFICRARRDADADIMRIICSFCVVLLHTVAYCGSAGLMEISESRIINVFCRFGVPVFVFISGRYMLSQERELNYYLIKAARILLIMCLTAAVYAYYEYKSGEAELCTAAEIVEYIFTSPIHLWYLYTTAALYILTPVIGSFVKNAGKNIIVYSICICFISGSFIYTIIQLNGFEAVKAIVNKCNIGYKLGFIGCYMLGHYFYRFDTPRLHRCIIYMLGLLGAAFSVLADKYLQSSAAGEVLMSFFAPNVLIQSAAAYLLIQQILRKYRHKCFLLSEAAEGTLFVYLFHILIMKKLTSRLDFKIDACGAALIAAATYIICLGLALIYRLIMRCAKNLGTIGNKMIKKYLTNKK